MREELNERIAAAGKVFYAINKRFIQKREVSKETKMAVYRSEYVPPLTSGSESWALKEVEKSRIQAAEMRYLRSIEGNTRRNSTIRVTLKAEPLMDTIERGQLRWFGHVNRMTEDRLPRKAYDTRVSGRRPRGKRRLTWEERVRKVIERKGENWTRAKSLSKDRKEWKLICKILYTCR